MPAYRSFVSGRGVAGGGGQVSDAVGLSTVRTVLSCFNEATLAVAGRRMAKRFGRGAFLVRFASLAECHAGRAEVFETALRREVLGLLRSSRRAAPGRDRRRHEAELQDAAQAIAQDHVSRTAGRALNERIVYTSLKDLQMMRMGQDMRILDEYDAQQSVVLCGLVSLAGDPGCDFDDVLLSISCMTVKEAREESRAAPRASAGPREAQAGAAGAEGPAPPEGGGLREELRQEVREEVREANARAKADKLARRRRAMGCGLVPSAVPRRPEPNGAEEAEAPRAVQVTRKARRRPFARKEKGKASGDRAAARLLETVRCKLLEKPEIEEVVACRDAGVREKKPVAPPSKAKQAKLVLHLSEFQEAVL